MRTVTVRVACVQLRARSASEAEAALRDVLDGIAGAAARGADIAVLPESSVPAYVLLGAKARAGRSGAVAVREAAAAARKAGVAVALGVARAGDDGRLRNEAVFIDRRGFEIARYAKMFLWNFDARWFSPGTDIPAFDTEFGRLGMMICADGRMPEIARTLARRGAWLILDPTAWVSAGRTYEAMPNPQVAHVIKTRARENGVWIAAADKCGSENLAVHYVGRSMIVAPSGETVALAPAGEAAIVVADLERARPRPFVVQVSRGEAAVLTRRSRPKRVARAREARSVRIGILQGPVRAGRAAAIATLAAQWIDAVVDTASSPAAIGNALRRVPGVRFALLDGKRMLAPEPARAAALAGADVLVWTRPPSGAATRDTARTRAMENKVFAIVCARARDVDPACAIDPSGEVVVEGIEGRTSAFVAAIDTASARDKTVVPGTDAFSSRVPRAFALFGDGGGR